MNKPLNLFRTPQADARYFPLFRSVVNIDDPWHGRSQSYRQLFPLGTLFLELAAYHELPPEWVKTLCVTITVDSQKIIIADIVKVISRRWGSDGLCHIGVETSPIFAHDFPPDARFHLITTSGYEWNAPLCKRLNRV